MLHIKDITLIFCWKDMTLLVQIYERICMDDNEMPVGCPVGGGGRGGIQKLQIDGCFMFMYKVLFLVEAILEVINL